MNKSTSLLLTSLSLFVLHGCATFDKLEQKNLPTVLSERSASLPPVNDTAGKTARVVIRIKQPVNPERDTKNNLLQRLQQSYDRELGKLPGMVVDRSLSKSISSEIELSEIYGKDSGRQDADYVMMLALDDYTSDQSSEENKTLFSKKPYATCKIEASYKGWVRVLTIPALEKTAQWEIEEDMSDSYEETNVARCRSTFTKHLQALQSKMLDNTVCKSKNDYLNALSPTGHVLSLKNMKESVLIETSLGSSVNASKGDKVYFYHELAAKPYADGVIEKISPKTAWVKLESMKEKETISKYDWVRPNYSGIDKNLLNRVKCLF